MVCVYGIKRLTIHRCAFAAPHLYFPKCSLQYLPHPAVVVSVLLPAVVKVHGHPAVNRISHVGGGGHQQGKQYQLCRGPAVADAVVHVIVIPLEELRDVGEGKSQLVPTHGELGGLSVSTL